MLGGLGNQMFRYAAGRSLAEKVGTGLVLDLSHFAGYKLRNFELDIFRIKAEIRQSSGILAKIGTITSKLKSAQKKYREKHFHFDADFFDLPDGTYLRGDFQSEKYFFPVKDLIRRNFTFAGELNNDSKKYLALIRNAKLPVSIHFRITDYLKSEQKDQYHYVLPGEYYRQSIFLLSRRLLKPVYFIFSDDLNYVKMNYDLPVNAVFIDREVKTESWEDMRLMSLCRHHIIANSTFSWWAAWLNSYTKKVIISPLRWFDNNPSDTGDLIPETWVKI